MRFAFLLLATAYVWFAYYSVRNARQIMRDARDPTTWSPLSSFPLWAIRAMGLLWLAFAGLFVWMFWVDYR